jgi:hypothetical protein
MLKTLAISFVHEHNATDFTIRSLTPESASRRKRCPIFLALSILLSLMVQDLAFQWPSSQPEATLGRLPLNRSRVREQGVLSGCPSPLPLIPDYPAGRLVRPCHTIVSEQANRFGVSCRTSPTLMPPPPISSTMSRFLTFVVLKMISSIVSFSTTSRSMGFPGLFSLLNIGASQGF